MSSAANPNRKKKEETEASAAAAAARQQKAERERIRRLIITLGDDTTKKVVSQIRGLAGALEDDVETHGELMQETLLECVQWLPLKSGILATWLGRMAEKRRSFAETAVRRVFSELRSAVFTGRMLIAQLLLRFLVGLGSDGLLPLPEVITLLHDVLAMSEGLKHLKGGDIGVFLALVSLPFLSPKAHSKVTEHVDSMLAKIGEYMAGREAKWKRLLRPVKAKEAPDRLEALFAVVQAIKKSGWSTPSIRFVPGGEPRSEASEQGSELLPRLGIRPEELQKAKVVFQVPLMSLHLASGSTVAPATSEGEAMEEAQCKVELMEPQDRWILEDHVLGTIEAFASDIEECSKQVLKIPFLHPQFEAVTVDVICSQLLRLPAPSQLPLFYLRLLHSMCSKQHTLQKVLDDALRGLIELAADMDEEALDMLADSFAYHITHMSWQVKWELFSQEQAPPHLKRLVSNIVARLQRLSYQQCLLTKLPLPLRSYVPPEPVHASDLAVQQKPEFKKMVGFVRIKNPNARLVLRYCHLLLKYKDGTNPSEDAGPAAEKPDAKEESAASSKRYTFDDGVEFDGDEPGEEQAADQTHASEDKTGEDTTEPPAKRARLEGKETGDAGTPVAAVANGGGGSTNEEFDFAPAHAWSLPDVAELLTASLMQHGATTPTHMAKILDGYQEVLLSLQPREEEKARTYAKAVASCVVSFWRLSGHRLEITLDTFQHRGILTARVIAETALAQRSVMEVGWWSVWRIIDSMARKVLERMLIAKADLALAKKAETPDAATVTEGKRKVLQDAVKSTNEFFTVVFAGLVRNYHDFREKDPMLQQATLQRILAVGRRYFEFITPLIKDGEDKIPGVKGNPDLVAVFHDLRCLQ